MPHLPDEITSGARRRPSPRVAILVTVLVVAALAVRWMRPQGERGVVELVGPTMGTSFSVRIDADLSEEERERVRAVVEERLERVDQLASTYDTASELSRFNRSRETEAFVARRELIEIVALARSVAERSGGAFDPTVAPLVEAWGFGPASGVLGPGGAPPSGSEIERLRALVGYDLIVVDSVAGTLTKAHPEIRLDLSGIAKGWAVEAVAEALRREGLSRFLVEVGGELGAFGVPRDGEPWRVGVERPDEEAPGVVGSIALTDEGIATSGDYRDFYELDGTLVAHIVDPRTGRPLPVRRASVTVVHASAAAADAWATALTVLGPVDGYDLAVRGDLAALFVGFEGEALVARATPALGVRFVVAEGVRVVP